MPNLNGRGPQGYGSRTGRGLGHCPGYGCGPRGFGRGFGWGAPYPYYQPTEKEEKQMLQDELKALREEAKEIEDRLEGLKEKK